MILSKKDLMKKVNRIYREPIEIQKKTESVQNGDGTWSDGGWVLWKKVFANVTNLKGQEYFVAGQSNKQDTVKFFVRFMPEINNEVKEHFRILYRGKTYNIEFVDNIKYLNEELEIKAEERVVTDGTV